MKYAYYNSIIGTIEIGYAEQIIHSIKVKDGSCSKENSAFTDEVYKQLVEYFLGNRISFDFPYKLIGTSFQTEVWNCLRTIPYGSTASYQDIAIKINRPKAARAIGNAVNKNPLLIVIPCHRVINKNGKLGGFALDISIKHTLLEIEKGY